MSPSITRSTWRRRLLYFIILMPQQGMSTSRVNSSKLCTTRGLSRRATRPRNRNLCQKRWPLRVIKSTQEHQSQVTKHSRQLLSTTTCNYKQSQDFILASGVRGRRGRGRGCHFTNYCNHRSKLWQLTQRRSSRRNIKGSHVRQHRLYSSMYR